MIFKCFNTYLICIDLVIANCASDAMELSKCNTVQLFCRKDDVIMWKKWKRFSIKDMWEYVVNKDNVLARITQINNKKWYSYTWFNNTIENYIKEYVNTF